MEPRGRGRARGRARGEPSERGTSRPGGQGGGGPPQGAWGRPQGPPQQQRPQGPPQQHRPQGPPQQQRPQGPPSQPPQGAWGRQPQGGPPQQQFGRGARVGGEAATPRPQVQPSDSGDGDSQRKERGGNGGVRGRFNRNEIIHTKPANMQSKKGTSGSPITLTANFFKLINKPDWCLHQYRVDFSPDLDDTRIRRKLVQIAFKHENDIGGFLFDGTVMFTPLKLQPDPMERHAKTESGEQVSMSVRHVSELGWGDHHYLQVFNLLVRRCLRMMKMQLVQRNYYDPNAQITIPDHRLCLWPGYYTSIRQHESDIMMNAELTFKIMRTDNVYDLLLQTTSRGGRDDMDTFRKKIIGSVVLTFYNNKTYRVDDVDFRTTPASTFEGRDKTQISFIQYYKQRYNININVPSQPMLVTRSSKREIRAGSRETILLVPELCQLTGLTDDQRANFQLMSALHQHTRIGPGLRQQRLQEFVQKMMSNPEIMKEVKRWDLGIANQLIQFQGRVLNQEKIKMGGEATCLAGPKADWTNSLRSNPMIISEKMSKMAVICPHTLERPTQEFMEVVCKAGNGMRWSLAHKIFTIPNDRIGSYLDRLEEVISGHNPTLVMCVLPTKTADRYNAIKKKCCVDRGVPSQVVVARNFRSKGVLSIATKVAIQLNCKIGGAPWAVVIPMKGLMVVGYDVCRDTVNRGKSFGGMVASLNQGCTRYFSCVSEHELEEELSNNFGAYMLLACQKYREVNGFYPAKILIYRDGVGDGQIPYVLNHEIKTIKEKLEAEIYNGQNELKMAFVIVSKRINTRIFDQKNNPPPGTVVDNTVTLPERYDFFIVSQCVNQGTVAPTSYNVVYDNMGLSPDHMQILSYKMCHMYYNWSGTVRVPAPCQYAHKLALLTAQSLHRPANRKLETLLYYL